MTDDPLRTHDDIEYMKERYLLKTAIQQALRSLYGDRGQTMFISFADEMSKELQHRGVQLRRK